MVRQRADYQVPPHYDPDLPLSMHPSLAQNSSVVTPGYQTLNSIIGRSSVETKQKAEGLIFLSYCSPQILFRPLSTPVNARCPMGLGKSLPFLSSSVMTNPIFGGVEFPTLVREKRPVQLTEKSPLHVSYPAQLAVLGK